MKKFLSIVAVALVMFIILIMAAACSSSTSTSELRAWDNKYNYAIIIIDGTVYAEGYLDAIAFASNDDTFIDILIDGKPYCTHPDNILLSWKGE